MLEAIVIQQLEKSSVVDSRPAPVRVTATPTWARPVTRQCLDIEAKRQGLEILRILAVMSAEGGRVGTFSPNTNGSYDMGPMQINTVHLPELSRMYRVSERHLAQLIAYDGCFNMAIGAYMLRQKTNEAGGDFWYGIGRYHSKTADKSTAYILRVHGHMKNIVAGGKGSGGANVPVVSSRP